MSQPPDYPGRKRLHRMASRSAGGAYEGAFEAVGAILIATGLGYWVDQRYETEPTGLLIGAAVGFGAFVLRLFRLGRTLQAGFEESQMNSSDGAQAPPGTETEEQDSGDWSGPGEDPGRSHILDESEDAH